jgi:hypothetical protein
MTGIAQEFSALVGDRHELLQIELISGGVGDASSRACGTETEKIPPDGHCAGWVKIRGDLGPG